MKKILETLYKKTSTGKIQEWKVWTEENVIYSQSGQVDGKKIDSQDIVEEGKNIGRSNETTPAQQAEKEALGKWIARQREGYVDSIEKAENNETSKYVEGGIVPTTAMDFTKRLDKKHIEFPCYTQPKLDGIRCTYSNGKLWSRSRKEIISVPHITDFLTKHLPDVKQLDGELYNHDFKDDFEQITTIVGQRITPSENHELVQYHVYDIPLNKLFHERLVELNRLADQNKCLKVVTTTKCNSEEHAEELLTHALELGYEGLMLRNMNAPYEYKRSKHLQKYKVFMDKEFQVVGVEEGRGKLKGHAGSFVCVTKEGNSFNTKLVGKLVELKQYYDNPEKYIGKWLTVKFQGYTNKNNVPRFPTAQRFRDEILDQNIGE